MNEEIWIPIVIMKNGVLYDYTGCYEVSNFGRVRSVDRIVRANKGVKLLKGQLLVCSEDKCGYKVISLWLNGKPSMFKVHRLVANAFIENPNNYQLINHKDEDVSNNIWTNLEWCDASYNRNYGTAIERGRKTAKVNDPNGERFKRIVETKRRTGVKTSPKEIVKIDPVTGEIVAEYSSMTEASADNGNNQHISDAAIGKRNTAAGYKWKYKCDYYGSI